VNRGSTVIYIYIIYIYICVCIYLRAWLPSQALRGGLASHTRTCMGTLRLDEDSPVASRVNSASALRGSTRSGKFFDWLSDCYIVGLDSADWN
jgi:hypothetical protein